MKVFRRVTGAGPCAGAEESGARRGRGPGGGAGGATTTRSAWPRLGLAATCLSRLALSFFADHKLRVYKRSNVIGLKSDEKQDRKPATFDLVYLPIYIYD